MTTLSNGMNTFNNIASLAKYVPYIGTAVNIVKNSLNAVRQPFNQALSRVRQIDAKIYPWKDRCDRGVGYCEQGETSPKLKRAKFFDHFSHWKLSAVC